MDFFKSCYEFPKNMIGFYYHNGRYDILNFGKKNKHKKSMLKIIYKTVNERSIFLVYFP
jgi:hypothetical protein